MSRSCGSSGVRTRMRRLGLLLIVLCAPQLLAPATGAAQAPYTIPPDNPFVSTPGAAPEVWMYGMRNPYRWSFDRLSGHVYVGDVGGSKEEITFLPALSAAGANLGWNCFSGTDHVQSCDPPDDVAPAFEYPSSSDVVIGGHVIRDPMLPGLAGRYVYGRFNTGLRLLNAGATLPEEMTAANIAAVSGLGEDGIGRLYATSLNGGLYRLVQSGSALDDVKVRDFNQPVGVAAPAGDPERLFVVELGGRIVNLDGSVFLDLTSLVRTGGEQGLLAMAVAPDYATSGRVFAFYTDNGGDLQLDEFTRTGIAPERSEVATRRPLLTTQHDQADNHNGGQLLFGPDRMLYLSTGDGGTQGDPEGDAQNLGSLLGKVLRLDVGVPGAGAALPPASLPAPPLADTTPPTLSVRARRRQRVLRLRGAIAYALCSEAFTVRAGGALRVGERRLRMRPASRALAAQTRARLRVRLTRRGVRVLRRSLQRGRRASVLLRLRATDGAGNRSALVRRTVRVVRRR